MATYFQIQLRVAEQDGFVPRSCWIADVRELNGLPVRRSWNRRGSTRANPCPARFIQPIEAALRFYRDIS